MQSEHDVTSATRQTKLVSRVAFHPCIPTSLTPMNSKIQTRMWSALATVLLSAVPALAQTVVQGPVVNPANGHEYYRLSSSSWTAAETAANALGGFLVTIDDVAENTFVLNTFANAVGSGRIWLGYTDQVTEGTFLWTSGLTAGYTNWTPGEPNNAGGNEDFTHMYPGNGQWNDVPDVNGVITYGVIEVVPGGNLALNTTLGAGCYARFASFYEQMSTAAFDLTNTDIIATNTGVGYVAFVTPGTGPLPVGGVDPLGGTVLTLGDDNQVVAGTLGLSVGSNGWVAVGGGNSNGFTPTTSAMLSNPSATVYFWTDLQPNTSGTVTYEEDVATGQTRTTFDGVNGWNTPDPVFIQCDYNVTTGDWAIRFGTVGFANPEDWIVGYSPAGPSSDPGATDLSAAAVILTEAADVAPLTLSASTRPITGASWDQLISNIPAGGIALHILGLSDPNIADLSVIGMPGCGLRASLDFISVVPGSTFSLAIPNLPALIGMNIYANGAALTAGVNAFGAVSSNGVRGTIGDT